MTLKGKINELSEDRFSKIISEIQKNPGIRFRELARICHIPTSTMTYYANKLDKTRVVKVRKTPRECRFFPNHLEYLEKVVIVSLRKKTQRQILLLLQRKEQSFSDIFNAIGLAPSTMWAKLSSLEKRGIVNHRYQNRQKLFKLKDSIPKIIKKYQNKIKISER